MDKLIKACVSILPKPLRKIYYKYEEKWLYLFFGVLTTAVSFITAGIAKYVLENAGSYGDKTVADISTAFSWVCAVTFAYITNRLWVFDSEVKDGKSLLQEAGKFYGGRVFTLGVEWVIMHVVNGIMGFNYWLTKIGANVIVLILNYVISKILVFRNKDGKAEEKADEKASRKSSEKAKQNAEEKARQISNIKAKQNAKRYNQKKAKRKNQKKVNRRNKRKS